MSDVVIFTPKHELDGKANLDDFIEFSEKIVPFGSDFDRASNYWKGIGNFTKFGVNSRTRDNEDILHSSILSFAKAYMLYDLSSKSKNVRKLFALRAIEETCRQQYGVVAVNKLSIIDFDKAAQIARNNLQEGAAYQAGLALKELLSFLSDKKIIKRFIWKSPNRKPREKGTDDASMVERENRMPDEHAIYALADIFSQRVTDLSYRDILTTSVMTILISAPSRGSEPFYLRSDCLHEETMEVERALNLGLPESDILCLLNKKGKKQYESKFDWYDDEKITLYGIRWYSGKGYGYENKWLPTVMYDGVISAITRLKEQSEEARKFARMLTESDDFPRHKLCPNVPNNQTLTKNQVALALGLDISVYEGNTKQLTTSVNQLLKRKGIERKDGIKTLNDINKIIRNSLPDDFPYIRFRNSQGGVKLKWQDALFANFSNGYDGKKATILTELAIASIGTLNEDLAPTKKTNKKDGTLLTGVHSIFQRHGYGDLRLTTHQFRHLLDTIAATNGMEGELRAKYAMRADSKQNRFYNHTPPEEYGADFIEDRETQLVAKNESIVKKYSVKVATPRTLQELNTKTSLTAHTTEFGMCITSYLSEPCTKYRDCINCNEHVCTKGDDGKCDRIRDRLKKENQLLEKDKKAVENKVPGAERWLQRRLQTVERCAQLLEMMENPEIEDGALIKLSNIEDVTLLDRALEANGRKRLPEIKNHKRIENISVEAFVTKSSVDDKGIFDDLNSLDELD